MRVFQDAQEAFESLHDEILENGVKQNNTLALKNVLFVIENPERFGIHTLWRKWKLAYAEYEWDWYRSGNRSVSEIKKKAKIWDTMHNGDNIVNSNYGYQWYRGDQLNFVMRELSENPLSRRAVMTIYDGKENKLHKLDTPCTLNIIFDIEGNKLNMMVSMRSNDLWFGFCNDQYCFYRLQEFIAFTLNIKVGTYTHYAHNLHLYERHFKVKENFYKTGELK